MVGREDVASVAIETRRDRRVLLLLWVLPLAVAVAGAVTLLAAVAWCGTSGCAGGGFGSDASTRWAGWALLLVAGAVVAVPIAVVPWARRREVRVVAGVVVGFAWVVAAALLLSGG